MPPRTAPATEPATAQVCNVSVDGDAHRDLVPIRPGPAFEPTFPKKCVLFAAAFSLRGLDDCCIFKTFADDKTKKNRALFTYKKHQHAATSIDQGSAVVARCNRFRQQARTHHESAEHMASEMPNAIATGNARQMCAQLSKSK